MSHIFISYSRRDLEVTQRIVDALSQQELETWIDWRSIPKGEDWEQEIYRGIEGADAFLFLISPNSIKSVMCNKEIIHAIKNNKRILPIMLKDVETQDFQDPAARAEIKRLNWIFCRNDRDDFDQVIEAIKETIRTDYDWLRFHTTLQTRALAWHRAKQETSRLLRGKELREIEKQIIRTGPKTEPYLTDLQRGFITRSRRAVRVRQALPYSILSLLAMAIFVGGKFYFLLIPIANACPEVVKATVQFEDTHLPDSMYQTLLKEVGKNPAKTRMSDCDAGAQAEIQARANYMPATGSIELYVRLPETPAYQLDFLQEIREFEEVVSEAEAIALLHAYSAYSVGEYQMASDSLEGYDSLSALTLLAQARLFTDDREGSQGAYEQALQKPLDDDYAGKLYMGAALALWRPENYALLSQAGNKDDCKKAGSYYVEADKRLKSDKWADNIRIIYANLCILRQDESDPDYAPYAPWKIEVPQSESSPNAQHANNINATQQFILAFTEGYKEDAASRELYKERLTSAQTLMLARAALSEFYWEVEGSCRDARKWLDEFRSEITSNVEKVKLRRLLRSQPLFCR
jgi:hypothetical protein